MQSCKKVLKLTFAFTLLLLCVFLIVPNAHSVEETERNAANISSAPVAPFGETLFFVYGDVGVISVQMRAQIISENIISLRKGIVFDPDVITMEEKQGGTNILYMDKVIMGITSQQEKALGKPKNELAAEYIAIITDAVKAERSRNEFLVLFKQLGLVIAIIALAFFLIKGINWLHDYIKTTLLSKKDSKSAAILEVDKNLGIFFSILNIIKILLILFLLYICFLAFLWFFPETHGLAYTLIGYIKNPLVNALAALWHYMPNLIEIVVIIFLFMVLSKTLLAIAKKIAVGKIKITKFHPDWAIPTYQIIKIILIIFAFIFIFPLLPKSNSSVFKGISVFLGVLFSLGSTTLINNMVSGIVITYMRPFNIGDIIKMGEHMGEVIEKSSLVTRLKTSKNEIITIPNSTIMTANTTNYTNSAKNHGLVLHTEVSVGYDIDWKKASALLTEAALKTTGVLKTPAPFTVPVKLDDFYVQYQINAYTNDVNIGTMYAELNQNILEVFNREGIELLSPHFNALRNADAVILPKKPKAALE